MSVHEDLGKRLRCDRDLWRVGAAMEAAADAVFLVDAERMVLVDVNPAACEMLGRSRTALLGLAPELVFAQPRAALQAG